MLRRHDALAVLDRYIRIPTISRQVTTSRVEDVRAFWKEIGLALEPLSPEDGAGTPALYGEIPGPRGARTLLLYGHYDVQPTGDLSRWRWEDVACQPFAPTYFRFPPRTATTSSTTSTSTTCSAASSARSSCIVGSCRRGRPSRAPRSPCRRGAAATAES